MASAPHSQPAAAPDVSPESATHTDGPLPTATVVVVTYSDERWQLTLDAIRSVREQEERPEEILLVVDHNPPLARRFRRALPDVRVLDSEEQAGASGARNTGIRHSASEIIAFLDDDELAGRGWLRGIKRVYQQDPGAIAVGGSVSPRWPESRPVWFPEEFGWVVGGSYLGQPVRRAKVRNLFGGNMSLRRSPGGSLPTFSHRVSRRDSDPVGGEDTLFSIELGRTAPRGHIVYDPAINVRHHVQPDYASFRHFLRRCWSEGLSKAAVSSIVGSQDALSVERHYVLHTLARGVARRVLDGLGRASAGQLAQAGAIVLGLLVTTTGFVSGSLRRRRRRDAPQTRSEGVGPRLGPNELRRPANLPGPGGGERSRGQGDAIADAPTWVGQIEIGGDVRLDGLNGRSRSEYARARILARLHGHPMGFVEVPHRSPELGPEEIAATARRDLSGQIRAHLQCDGVYGHDGQASDDALPALCANGRPPAHFPLSVVVCTHERPDLLAQCLRGLRRLRYQSFEVVVVDNAPLGDETRRCFHETVGDDPRFCYVREPVKGLSSARNRGLAQARHPHVAFTDDDVVVDPGWLGAIAGGFAREPGVVCVTGFVSSASLDHEAERYFDRRVSWSDRFTPSLHDARKRRTDNFPFDVSTLGAGANFAVERHAVIELGGFDEALGAGTPTGGGEDLDIFARLLGRGGTLAYEPSALVWHFHRVDSADLRRQMRAYGASFAAFVLTQLRHPPGRRSLLRQLPRRSVEVVRRWSRYGTSMPGASSLVRAELRGWITGPVLYRRSRRAADRRRPAPLR